MKIQESFLPSFIFFSTGSDSRFWEFHPSSVILGVFVFFFIFCESLALYAKSRGLIYTIYIYFRVKTYRELKLVRALDEGMHLIDVPFTEDKQIHELV